MIGTTRTRFIVVGIVTCLIAFAILFYSGKLFRVEKTIRWNIRFCDGDKADIDATYSNSDEIALAPNIVWGGGSPWYNFEIRNAGKSFHWSGELKPIIVEKSGGRLWLVVWNSDPRIVKDEFFIYCYQDNGWRRADRQEFEPRLAIANLDWNATDSAPQLRDKLEFGGANFVKSVDFCGSTTARLWLYLSGQETARIHYTLDETFVLEFYKREIKGRCGYDPAR